MNIVIDGRVWSRNASGVTTFLNCALPEWARQQADDHFYVVLPKGLDPSVEHRPLPSNVHLLDYSGKVPKRLPNIIALQWLMPRLCRRLKADLYYAPVPHVPFFLPRRTKTMVTVHDVVNIEMKETMAWTNRLATSIFFKHAITKADYLWANSHYTEGKVEQYYPRRRSKALFVGDSSDETHYYLRQTDEDGRQAIKQRYGVEGKMLLFVGSLEPRKNLAFLLRLMPRLYGEHGVKLVVVGGKGWKNSDLRAIVEAPDYPREAVVFCGYVTSEELALLYHAADCFVSAALMEGFGMPQLEALKCGCPIVTAHNTAMVEVANGKDGATTVEGYNPDTWARAILDTLRRCPKVNQAQLGEYDWIKIIDRLRKYLTTP